MTKKRVLWGMAVLALVLGLAGCESAPEAAISDVTVSAAPDSTGGSTYYVRENGRDTNPGTTENKPFKTLTRAIAAASGGTVKTITVLGTLTSALPKITEGTGAEEILITGKANAAAMDAAVLQIQPEGDAFAIGGASRIRLEHITVTGGTKGGLSVNEGAALTLGEGAVVSGNSRKYGGGIQVNKGTLVLRDNALVTKNTANAGGGIAVLSSGTIRMQDDALVSENWTDLGNDNKDGEGGGVYAEDTEITMEGNAAIVKNKGYWGAGIYIDAKSTMAMRDSASIRENANVFILPQGKTHIGGSGGGAYINGSLTMRDTSAVSGNAGGAFGGGIYIDGGTVVMEDRAAVRGNKVGWGKESDGTLFGGFGGGINLRGTGTLAMKGESSLEDNSGLYGAGLRVVNGAAAVLEGRASIKGNDAWRYTEEKYGGMGGGAYINTGCTLTLKENAAVRDNEAFWGGGVDLYGTLTLVGNVKITGNAADNQGGGVYFNEGGALTGGASLVSGNTAAEGADIYTTGEAEVSAAAGGVTAGDFEIKDGVLVKYHGLGGAVVIPAGVTAIGEGAFSMTSLLNTVSIPDGVTRIGKEAFYMCYGLSTVNIPDGVTSIGESAFAVCMSLTSIRIPDSVTSIGNLAFNASGLKTVSLSVKTALGNRSFPNTAQLVYRDAEGPAALERSAEQYNRLGLAAYQEQDYDSALTNYSQAIQLAPDYGDAYTGRGMTYYVKKEYDHAIADWTEAIRFIPNDALLYIARANAYTSKNDFVRARADWETALKIDPQNANALSNLEALRQRGY
jgi:Flp pilus assembly protein TadD